MHQYDTVSTNIRKQPRLQCAEKKASSLSSSSSPLLGDLSCFFVVACWYSSLSQGTLGCDPVLHALPPMWRSEVWRMKVRLQSPDSLPQDPRVGLTSQIPLRFVGVAISRSGCCHQRSGSLSHPW